MKALLFLIFNCFIIISFSQSVEGHWYTYDDDTGVLKSKVKIYVEENKLYAEICELYNTAHGYENPKCLPCPGERKNQRVIGMKVITGLEKEGDEWQGENAILDPKEGEVYDCTIWMEDDNKLAVRGYQGIFFRTQYWKRCLEEN
jgi:uncharacterized protein (DUF2147 family)